MAPERTPAKPPLNRNQLWFGLVGVVALGLGVWQLRHQLQLPLGLGGEASPEATIAPGAAVSDEVLRQRDTDGDGLSDYDEQYLYKTSAYLKDTDSDGYDDKTEVATGNDPHCTSGQTCSPVVPAGAEAPAQAALTIPSAGEIRELLRRSGVSDQDLARYSDEQLEAIYRELASEVPVGQASEAPLQLTAQERETLLQLRGPELRQFLIRGGADADQLKALDDDTLEAMVREMLSAP